MAGKSKLNEIAQELKRLNYSPEEEQKPLNYKIQVGDVQKVHPKLLVSVTRVTL